MSFRVEPRWLPRAVAQTIHADQIRQHGGALGIRDEGLLASALERARNRWQYDPESDLPTIAAALGYGLARNHAFIDGNKRVAFQAMYVFLGLNGLRVAATEPAVVSLMMAVADGSMTEEDLVEWLRSRLQPR
ncbi:MAG: type II toxin-antitoxin system death-on-curing family toxin [bacterium]|nr:type II toxin-antitoxin system death-on-curing family toxin [bacterium]